MAMRVAVGAMVAVAAATVLAVLEMLALVGEGDVVSPPTPVGIVIWVDIGIL